MVVHNSMSYNQFSNLIIKGLETHFADEGIQLVRLQAMKVNQTKDALSVRFPNTSVSPTIYLDDMYQIYCNNYSFDMTLERVISSISHAKEFAPEMPSFNKSNLFCTLVNYENNKELLKDTPHERLMDLAIIPRCRVDDNSSFIVKNNLCEKFGLTSSEIIEYAKKNIEPNNYILSTFEDLISSISVDETFDNSLAATSLPFFILTNKSNFDGSNALVSKKVLDDVFRKLNTLSLAQETIYLLACSRHELLVIPDSMVGNNIEEIKSIHQEVQKTVVDIEDRLSNSIYAYIGLKKQLLLEDELNKVIDMKITPCISKSLHF